MKRVLLALALLVAVAVAAEEVAPPALRPSAAVSTQPARARLAAWRAGARPPGQVPPTAIVRAAARGTEKDGADAPAGARESGGRPTVEILWNAPGSGNN